MKRFGVFAVAAMIALATFGSACNRGAGEGARPEGAGGARAMLIENITWQLAEVGGAPAAAVPADAQAAHFKLDSGQKRAIGYGGVNQFSGAYELNGALLKFGPAAMTRRAGPEPLMKQEHVFAEAMGKTAAWRAVNDHTIELLDAEGKGLAKFAAR